ncbi:F-box/FBD/LRR-repeat protein At1g78750 isoform X1 [Arabidopsis lyrata subsp. lyrata]|uniref:F-box/FBD/LRR-repeat protein At1g78750 isoform X1 n=1 Tax=Arabidopsis lyrata subsp. lyrata TaxID=81972 RepID=UPI000A29E008|nr:F-box/FBD/LRR-repeat protein At1g78750 isoform X1 [Arabidopsis lyrata subsp. lyrata]|eukprot:XP_020890453.1 F-box/FBD/LRR-repeat protein At1g78750 isoform X1 [Arabidopsis lyrata subsp. lyrata]
MDEDGEKRVRAKGSGEVDWISDLPDCLLCQVLLKLPTKDVVKSSVLSTRWRNIWKYVPGLNLTYCDFHVRNTFSYDHNTFLSFVDSFMGFNRQSCFQSFKLEYDSSGYGEPIIALIMRWINSVVSRKVKYLGVSDDSCGSYDYEMPQTIYTCETLVYLTLDGLFLASPKFVSLPSLKELHLSIVKFADDLAFETLVSQCPVLENLTINKSFCDDFEFTCVRSQSLLSFTHVADSDEMLVEDLVVAIDAPKLKYLRLSDHRIGSFILKNLASLVEADIDTVFNLICKKMFDPNDLKKRNMIRDFLVGISNIKNLIIASSTLEVIYDYSRCEPLTLFHNLSSLRVEFYGYRWEMLPVFLESCPNLKSLFVGSANYREKEGINILSGPRRFLSSLKYVKIERPLKGEAKEMKLVSYLLENSTILKELTLCLDNSIKKEESVLLKELLTIPRLSTSCKVVVL